MKEIALLLSLVAAGCFPETEEPIEEPDAGAATDRTFTRLQAVLAGKILAVGIEEAASRFGPVAVSSANPGCTTPSGDISDPDNDSIPTDAKLSLDCSASRLGFSGALTGFESVTDDQPNALAWAFTLAADLQLALAGPFGGTMVADTAGEISASQDSALGPFHLGVALDVDTVITNPRGEQLLLGEAIDWTVSFRPGLDWTPGGPQVFGEVSTDGTWDVSINDLEATATLSTPTALTFTPSCKTLITAGQVVATITFGGTTASIGVEWTGCGGRAVSYDVQ